MIVTWDGRTKVWVWLLILVRNAGQLLNNLLDLLNNLLDLLICSLKHHIDVLLTPHHVGGEE